ncbi:MAG: hypothetical protein JWP57_2691 [Spirosoma sp.]|nr:hypothetical protein [Spirosoma sp.]
MIPLFQQRDFGNKINATFQYVSQNFRSLGLALLYIVGPVALLAGIMAGFMESYRLRLVSESVNARTDNPFAAFQVIEFFSSPVFWLTMLFGLLANVVVVLVTYAHMKVYERLKSPDVLVADVWAEVQPVIGRALVISLLGSIITAVGMCFLFIPGIYIAVVLSLALAVTSFEGTGFGETWERCFKLIRDKWWSTFGLIMVMALIMAIVGIIFAIPTASVAFLVRAKILPEASTAWAVIGKVIEQIGRTMLNAVVYLAIGFQYTNLVERQEGRGLISAIDSIGTSTQARDSNEGEY